MPTLVLQKSWSVKDPNPQLQVKFSNELQIHPIIAQLMINRHIQTVEEAKNFLNGSTKDLYDPFLLKDMDKAVKRIQKAKKNKETVMVFGDYDVDGVTSSTILHHALKKLGIKVINYIPHRFDEGYGLNHEIGESAKEQGVHLLIAIDCGITAHSEVKTLNDLDIDVIIMNHHEPDDGPLPEALAIINPKRPDCSYPFKNLASVGLAAKLSQALFGEISEDEMDLIAIGTIADVVPLREENRIFVKAGLPKINKTKNHGLAALLDVAKIKNKPILPHYVGFIIGPRINASGRMDSAQKSLDLLLSKNIEQAYALANFLEKVNYERQKLQSDIIQEALSMVERDINFSEHKVIVVSKKGWHKGVLGIVASRLTETYYRPAVVISVNDGVGTASARSINGFHLYKALSHCSSVLEAYGGHKGAAGLTIKEENIDRFKDMFNDFTQNCIEQESLIPTLDIDCEIPLSSVTMDLVKIIHSLEPYGEGNPAPIFCSRQVTLKSPPVVLGKETLKFWATDGRTTISAVGFRMGKYSEHLSVGQQVDLAYQISIDDWNKEPTVQLKLKDIKLSE